MNYYSPSLKIYIFLSVVPYAHMRSYVNVLGYIQM